MHAASVFTTPTSSGQSTEHPCAFPLPYLCQPCQRLKKPGSGRWWDSHAAPRSGPAGQPFACVDRSSDVQLGCHELTRGFSHPPHYFSFTCLTLNYQRSHPRATGFSVTPCPVPSHLVERRRQFFRDTFSLHALALLLIPIRTYSILPCFVVPLLYNLPSSGVREARSSFLSSFNVICHTTPANHPDRRASLTPAHHVSDAFVTCGGCTDMNLIGCCRKFGKQIQKRQLEVPEYAASFVNYKALKKVRAPSPRSIPNPPRQVPVRLQELSERIGLYGPIKSGRPSLERGSWNPRVHARQMSRMNVPLTLHICLADQKALGYPHTHRSE